ncbi:uncharacterized protein LOC124311312 isoform X2 [Daphnia pulicaria]|uniref:uncharacterized protein LOC124311312 isoform X2 n=1 Tax=Daphnia pulicaria TaxID=35523 RepID=UPI001EEB6B85|nr:uncharacterized protein LOC124311312 isoform X2 [Daphnia pulicaria]
MTKALKCGYLLRYKRRLFSRYWREEFIVLYEDSSMAWFKDKSRSDPEGALMLKEAPELMAMGEYTLRIPHTRPSSLPQGCTVRQVMAFGTPNRQKVYWFVAKSEDEINDWMTAISNTLPIPPGLSVYGEPADETTSNIYESIDLQPAAVTTAMAIEKQQLQQEHVHIVGSHQPCCLCAASGHGCGATAVASSTGAVVPAAAAAAGMKKKDNSVNSSLGEIATGMMLATGFAHWGWGYGLGWNKPDKSIIGGYSENTAYDDGYYGRDSMDARQMGNGCSQQHHYYPDYDDCQDNDFDMDFGGDFGF